MTNLDRLRATLATAKQRAVELVDAAVDFAAAYLETLSTFDETQIKLEGAARARNTDTAQCLAPFLKALGYRGTELNRVEAVPHLHDGMDIADLRAALVNLGYKTTAKATRAYDVDPRLLPCLHQSSETGNVVVLLDAFDNGMLAFANGAYRLLTPAEAGAEGHAYFATNIVSDRAAEKRSWSSRLARRFSPFASQLLVITGVSTVLSLAVPLFVMTIYDKVIALRALDVLPMLLVGIALVMAFDLYLKTLRARLLGAMAGRIDYLIGTATFAKLLRLPLSYTEGPPVSSQISRLREFQSVRDLFSGPAAAAIIDFPFTIISLAAVAFIAGWLVVVPFVACVAFAIAGFAGAKWLESYERAQSETANDLFNHVTGTTLHHESIKREGGEAVWQHRFRLKSALAATKAGDLAGRSAAVESFSQFLNSAAALGVLLVGTLMVLQGAITVGALIATMALTWRILSPAQQLFQTLARLSRLRSSIASMDQMLRLTDEYGAAIPNLARAPKEGRIQLSRVSLRYGKDAEPALVNINLMVPPKKMVALTGPNGAGKSSILRVIQGLYQPQAGVVLVDGLDIRQLPAKTLRRAIAVAPQRMDLFYGTIAQNLRLGDPMAGDDALRAAVDEVGLKAAIEALPEGFNTRIGDAATSALSVSFLRQLTIARALVRKAPVLLIDEPEAMLDDEGARAVQATLERLRGTRTVLFVSHRPSYIRIADFGVFMRGSAIEYGGKPEGAIEKLLGQQAKGGLAA